MLCCRIYIIYICHGVVRSGGSEYTFYVMVVVVRTEAAAHYIMVGRGRGWAGTILLLDEHAN